MNTVLHLIDTYRIGGPGKTILNSARFIDRTRFRLAVAAFTPARTGHTEFSAAVERAGIPFLDLRETQRFDLQHVRRLREHLRRHRVEVLHTHGYRSDVLGFLATRATPVALVTTHHGWIRNNGRQRASAGLALALTRWFDGVEVVCDALLAQVPRAVCQDGRAVVVHNALVLEDYLPRNRRDPVRAGLGLESDSPLIVVVGRLSVEKGGREMLDAFGELASHDPRVHLAFVGEGPLESELRGVASEQAWRHRVHFAGHQPSPHAFFEAADIVVSPSHTEGLSNVILEAMAFGRPVVATRVGGNPEIIEDGVSGLLVEARHPGTLAAGVRRLLADSGLHRACAENGRRRVITTFSFQARMRAEESFYERVLASRAGHHRSAARITRPGPPAAAS